MTDILSDIVAWSKKMYNESQFRWLGPEKGIISMACCAMTNAIWDLWSIIEEKPVWKLISDMSPELFVKCVDFTYVTDVISPEKTMELMRQCQEGKAEREKDVIARGFPVYTTSVGWLGYSDEKIRTLAKEYKAKGFKSFKMKVGRDLNDDKRRAKVIRDEIGYENRLMMDANQVWDVNQAIANMTELAKFEPYWIEEPTSPDDIIGHCDIAKALAKFNNGKGINVATGEVCHNKVMFKQFIKGGGMQVCQIDACRMTGISEILAVIIMAKVFKCTIVSHAGGVGLFEYVRHMSLVDFVLFGTGGLPLDKRLCEWTSHLHEHFEDESGGDVDNARFAVPLVPGYGRLKADSIKEYEYANRATNSCAVTEKSG